VYKKISDYGIIGNLHSVALVGLDGSIDWLCFPHIDSPSVFAAILDDEKGGRFRVAPMAPWDSTAEYLPGTNVLKTVFRTREGVVEMIDFMPFGAEGDCRHELFRIVSSVRGSVQCESLFEPRFDYGRGKCEMEPWNGRLVARGGGQHLVLQSSVPQQLDGDGGYAEWTLREGEKAWFHLAFEESPPGIMGGEEMERTLRETEGYWRKWLEKSETGRTVNLGPYQKMVERSELVLKLLFYEPTGTIVAAPTTSLPEEIGGTRNWDYRFTWVRDTAFTLQALFNLGHLSEMEGYFKWMERVLSQHGAEKLQVVYGLRGETSIPEKELSHLDGYKGSRPVRIGNEAAGQIQHDIYGELMDAALRLSDYVGKIAPSLWPFLYGICEHVVEVWRRKDYGIWEVRGGPHHFVYSKVMCWVALDRGIKIAKRYGFFGNLKKWGEAAEKIREEILSKGWNREKAAFVQHYGTDSLDATALLIPIMGFLPFDDPRVVSTVSAIENELCRNGFVYRYRNDDGIEGGEGAFLLCTFWLIDTYVGQKRIEEAERLLLGVEGIANHLGLFSEEYDPVWKENLGNFPQAFTHIGYINSVVSLSRAKGEVREKRDGERAGTEKKILFPGNILLNNGESRNILSPSDIVSELKRFVNILRGAFSMWTGGGWPTRRWGDRRCTGSSYNSPTT